MSSSSVHASPLQSSPQGSPLTRRRPRPRKTLSQWLALAPWWFSILLSAFTYIGLRYLLPPMLDNSDDEAAASLVYFFAPYIAFVLLIPLPFDLFRREERERLVQNERQLDGLRDLDLPEFCELLAQGFRRQGYGVEDLRNSGAKFDMVLRRGGEKTIVVCKPWQTSVVPTRLVRSVRKLQLAHGAAGSKIVTCGSFSPGSTMLAHRSSVELLDGPAVLKLLETPATQMPQREPNTRTPREEPELSDTETTSVYTPLCPLCSSPMIEQTGTATTPHQWSCWHAPKCGGIRPA